MAGLPPEAPPETGPGPSRKSGSTSTSAFFQRNKKASIAVAAVAGVAGLAYYKRHHGAPAGSASSTAATTTTCPGGYDSSGNCLGAYTGSPFGYDSSSLDAYNQLAGSISGINDTLDTLQSNVNSLQSASGPTSSAAGYFHVPNPAEGSALEASGQQLYWQPAGAPTGTFIPVPVQTPTGWPSGLPPGTNIFAKS